MNTSLKFAYACRLVARILCIPLLVMSVCYLVFVGAEMAAEGGNPTVFILFIILILTIFVGLIIAWRKEFLGAVISFGGIGLFIISSIAVGAADTNNLWILIEELSPLAGPIHLIIALISPGYNLDVSPIAKVVPIISWILLILPILLFLGSWLLRKNSSQNQQFPSN